MGILNRFFNIIFALFCAVFISCHVHARDKLSQWDARCQKDSCKNSVVTAKEFIDCLNGCCACIDAVAFDAIQDNWLDAENVKKDEFLTSEDVCYIQKLDVQADQQIYLFGDIHASNGALLWSLQSIPFIADDFTITENIETNTTPKMVFLGDYVDRGPSNVLVLMTLCHLKTANPQGVVLIRGNHEEEEALNGAFKVELEERFGENKVAACYAAARSLFSRLPAAVMLNVGENFAQLCHGGIEPFYKPLKLIQSDKIFERYKKQSDVKFGFHWTDFDFLNLEFFSTSSRDLTRSGKVLVAHKGATLDYMSRNSCEEHNFVAFFRGHQHSFFPFKMLDKYSPSLNDSSSCSHWKEIVLFEDMIDDGFKISNYHPVFTFSNAREAEDCNMPYDSYAVLTVQDNYADWTLSFCEKNRFLYNSELQAVDQEDDIDQMFMEQEEPLYPVKIKKHKPCIIL